MYSGHYLLIPMTTLTASQHRLPHPCHPCSRPQHTSGNLQICQRFLFYQPLRRALWTNFRISHDSAPPGRTIDSYSTEPASGTKIDRASTFASAVQEYLDLDSYSSKTGLLPSHPSTLLSGQPTERVARLPSLTGAGKSPLLTRRQIVVRDNPVTSTTSGILSILSIWNLLLWGAASAHTVVETESPC